MATPPQKLIKRITTYIHDQLLFARMQIVIVVLVVAAVLILLVQKNVSYNPQQRTLLFLNTQAFSENLAEDPAKCLYLYTEDDPLSEVARSLMADVFREMRIPVRFVSDKQADQIRFEDFDSVVLGVSNLSSLENEVLPLSRWIHSGGQVMLPYLPTVNGTLKTIQKVLGIENIVSRYVVVNSIHFSPDFMIGGDTQEYFIEDAYDSSISVTLNDDCKVYLSSLEDSLPLVWSFESGSGKVVVCNFNYFEKNMRGLFASAFSLLGDACVYPVINASTFYIDDFPSPVPPGVSPYIQRDYAMSTGDFYTQIWWPDVLKLAQTYNIRYTGLVIEFYSDLNRGPYPQNTDNVRYKYFGNQLLNHGGEIGMHGYNHLPLVSPSFNYQGMFPSYRQWQSYDDMKNSIIELQRFIKDLYPENRAMTYVPPSNILSDEARHMLAEECPELQAVASVYLPGELAYVQEFTIAEDGIAETPRIIAGYTISDYAQLAALSELNMHYVNTHFQHPDDVLDEDRGAKLGWATLYENITQYCQWLYSSAPSIRNLTGSELAGAVQRFDKLSISRHITEHSVDIDLGGFADEAWLFIRINDGTPGTITGGSIEPLLNNLYLINAQSNHISIELIK